MRSYTSVTKSDMDQKTTVQMILQTGHQHKNHLCNLQKNRMKEFQESLRMWSKKEAIYSTVEY